MPLTTIYRTLHEKLNYSLQVCYESAKQRDEIERVRYKEALQSLIQNPRQGFVIDETHKDSRASRRQRAWTRRNSGGAEVKKWFYNHVRYTMIAAMNIDGFIDHTIELVKLDEISSEGAAGTVDAERFESCVENYLCPALGEYSQNEPNSIVIMDNASTHMSERVRELIESTGTYLLYSAPYSPDLSPIEYLLNDYKSNL